MAALAVEALRTSPQGVTLRKAHSEHMRAALPSGADRGGKRLTSFVKDHLMEHVKLVRIRMAKPLKRLVPLA
jgi:hypothetical protein